MRIIVSKDFRCKLPSGKIFSSLKEKALFLEADCTTKSTYPTPPLRIGDHSELIFDIATFSNSEVVWLVEAATSAAKERLNLEMPNVRAFGTSLLGCFDPNLDIIKSFWEVHSELDDSEPWNYELPWAMFCMKSKPIWLTQKNTVILGSLLQEWDHICGAFVQVGWFGFLGVKREKSLVSRVGIEFPEVLFNFGRSCDGDGKSWGGEGSV